ncbi:MAG: putative lipid II flippase FtsW [Candidatus Andersenbacteria bacterium CG10_big_fil_rev_8_21_14_0_10_54_11]|uniref:Probable peptidoglycan glycosyltransferase FtsW n=1 Tax=Candidatus Andersenbacteria bacterium CG10_big_fil_rev_8_21_14_0_10_54_11 TaxID=1974485 RepID=A0A2M6WYH1_9BACT|nr:MAG: putative lipid II flippase FtsW [Candidatus Andersenbacteria bacterium CG10_big_fil_rev_8_21_14_0_10_54_11]
MADSFPRHGADHTLLFLVIALTLFGLLMVASASSVIAERFHDDAYFFVKHQIFFGGTVGLFLFLLGYFMPYRAWRPLALPAMLISLGLLVLVFVPGLQVAYGGASRWIGFGPFTIQPSEITKLAFILYLAALLEKKGDEVRNFAVGIVPFLALSGIIGFLIILQPDLGTLFSIAVIAFAMIFVAGIRWTHLTVLAFGGLSFFVLFLNTARYRLNRIIVYLHPELDPQGIGYQINQALLAVGTGGLWGLGLGRSRQKYQYLPEPAGDSIFAIVAEELGLVRTGILLVSFTVLGWRGYRIARQAPDVFGRLLACGITTWLLAQAFINIGSIMGLAPLTGIPLPFISYGGSSLAMALLASGVLLNISKYGT